MEKERLRKARAMLDRLADILLDMWLEERTMDVHEEAPGKASDVLEP